MWISKRVLITPQDKWYSIDSMWIFNTEYGHVKTAFNMLDKAKEQVVMTNLYYAATEEWKKTDFRPHFFHDLARYSAGLDYLIECELPHVHLGILFKMKENYVP